MDHFRKVILAVVAVILRVAVCGGQTQTPTDQVPTSTQYRRDPYLALIQFLYGVLEQIATSSTGILSCVTNHLIFPAMGMQIADVFENASGKSIGDSAKVIMEIMCREYASQFLTCLEKTVTSGSSKLDIVLQNVLDFPRLLAMVKYGCSKNDAITGNMACVGRQLTIMSDLVLDCFNVVSVTATNITNIRVQQVDEPVLKSMIRLTIELGKCMRPALRGCGELLGLTDHMIQEMTYMNENKKMSGSGPYTTGKSILLPLLAVAAVVVGELCH